MTAISSTMSPAGFSNSIAAAAFPMKAITRPSSRSRKSACIQEGKEAEARESSLAREREWISKSPKARQAKSKARITAYEELLAEVAGAALRARRRS